MTRPVREKLPDDYTCPLADRPGGIGHLACLIDEYTQTYNVFFDARSVEDILSVYVGGVRWNKAYGTIPRQGEWSIVDLTRGTFQLGSPPLEAPVRCDIVE